MNHRIVAKVIGAVALAAFAYVAAAQSYPNKSIRLVMPWPPSGTVDNYAPVRLKVTKTDDKIIEHQVKTYRGSEELPLADADLKEKLAMCIEAAGALGERSKADAAVDAVMSIEESRNVTAFFSNVLARCLS